MPRRCSGCQVGARSGSRRGVRGKPKPEQPEYNGPENETGTEDNEHRAITKSGAGLNRRLDCAAFFLVHGLPPGVPRRKRHLVIPVPKVLNVSSVSLFCLGVPSRSQTHAKLQKDGPTCGS